MKPARMSNDLQIQALLPSGLFDLIGAEAETETAEEGGESLAGETGGLISWQGGEDEDEDEEGGELTGSAAGEGGRGHCPALPLPLPLPWRQAR